jgi:hypothetical protein
MVSICSLLAGSTVLDKLQVVAGFSRRDHVFIGKVFCHHCNLVEISNDTREIVP